ncbi:hypothetical protein KL905_002437 [Ogataea polymorpha]|uniref:Branchpoint-bridging protein n=2 Tax=Ogataea polymorpha TaxID=460523 RepID=A0A9P8NWD2_9ASCO|nr:hypothetical protein KL937_002026 [Ogataea polymorpha]KAG7889260.1 hypothetical protein KL936_002834 [Ogataea polymorpha]KAG7894705.1 hypothetical protein KL908_002077 [Ogataea polymorpha]KAG7909788.1 hypothetical protein KL906_001693 [Ogataea polymorpha]KAG7921672.1 hypothetical protein KL905_002437 [Ogataea polymorpha]
MFSGEAQRVARLDGFEVPTLLNVSLTPEQLEAVQVMVRIEEINRMIQTDSFVPPTRTRSPSPPPVYDASGKRTNTREQRYKRRFETERGRLIENALRNIPDYRPPPDYRRQTKTSDKLYIPAREHPEINFIGLLMGPRGHTLKSIQEKSGAKIGIRGKGSVKEGKNTALIRPDQNNLDDDLHCLITADSEEKIQKAMKLCGEIIQGAISAPEGQNEHKRDQLKQLAILNGTLRASDEKLCLNCGEKGHKRYECPNLGKQSFAQSLVCSRCGNIGHLARDCKADLEETARHGRDLEMMMRDLEGETNGYAHSEATQIEWSNAAPEAVPTADVTAVSSSAPAIAAPPGMKLGTTPIFAPPPPKMSPPPKMAPPPMPKHLKLPITKKSDTD